MFFEKLKEQYLIIFITAFASITVLALYMWFVKEKNWRKIVEFFQNQAIIWANPEIKNGSDTIYDNAMKKIHMRSFWAYKLDVSEWIGYIYAPNLLKNPKIENGIQMIQVKEVSNNSYPGINNPNRINHNKQHNTLNVFLFTTVNKIKDPICTYLLSSEHAFSNQNDGSYEYALIAANLVSLNWNSSGELMSKCPTAWLDVEARWHLTNGWVGIWPFVSKKDAKEHIKPFKNATLLQIIKHDWVGGVGSEITDNNTLYGNGFWKWWITNPIPSWSTSSWGFWNNTSWPSDETIADLDWTELNDMIDWIVYVILLPL